MALLLYLHLAHAGTRTADGLTLRGMTIGSTVMDARLALVRPPLPERAGAMAQLRSSELKRGVKGEGPKILCMRPADLISVTVRQSRLQASPDARAGKMSDWQVMRVAAADCSPTTTDRACRRRDRRWKSSQSEDGAGRVRAVDQSLAQFELHIHC